jgi:PAS domain S-box-containing protein
MQAATNQPPRIRRLLLRLAAVMQIPLVMAGGLLFATHWDNQMDHVYDDMRSTTMAVATAMRERFAEIEQRLDSLAREVPLSESPSELAAFHAKAAALARELGVDVIVLIRPDGQQVINTRVPAGMPLPFSPEVMRKAVKTGRPAVNDLALVPLAKVYAAGAGVPVLRNGRIVYGLNAGLEAPRFARIFDAVKLPPGWSACIADTNRLVVAHTGRHASPVGTPYPYMQAGEHAPGNHGPFEVGGADGGAKQVFYRVSAISGWSSHVTVPHDVLYAPIRSAAAQLAAALALVSGHSLWGAARVGRRISNSVEMLGKAAREFPAVSSVTLPRATFGEAQEVVGALTSSADAVAQSQQALQRSEQRLTAILQTASSAIVVADAHHRVKVFNAAAEQIFGRASAEVVGDSVSALLGPRTWARFLRACDDLPENGGTGKPVPCAGARAGGALFPGEAVISSFRSDDGGRYCTLIVQDVSDRARARLELARAHREVRRVNEAFQRALLKESDAQLAGIARDLHDAVGSSLAGIALLVGGARGSCGADRSMTSLLDKVQAQVQSTAETVRRISHGIMPAGNEAGALLPALGRLADDIGGIAGVRCTFSARGDFDDVPADVSGHLYRIVQEASANALRHGRATHVRIALARAGSRCRLSVTDNGDGCDLARLPDAPSGLGLKSMQARAAALGGTIAFCGTCGRGCRVSVTWDEAVADLVPRQPREALAS